MYHVRTEQFEGPLELLLSLIEREKLDITRISLAQVADSFVDYVSREGAVPLEQRAQFLSVASRLLLLKSRALLPLLSFTDEEEEEIEDLESRLKEYRRFREASLVLGRLLSHNVRSFARGSMLSETPVFAPPSGVSATQLADYFRRLLGNIVTPLVLEERIVEEVITIEEKMLALESRIAHTIEAAFSDIAKESDDRTHVVVSFLALLELVRRRIFHVEQRDLFGEIRFRKVDVIS